MHKRVKYPDDDCMHPQLVDRLCRQRLKRPFSFVFTVTALFFFLYSWVRVNTK